MSKTISILPIDLGTSNVMPAYATVLGEAAGTAYDAIREDPVFSPDSRHVAYAATRGGKTSVGMDGQTSVPYDEIGTPIFSNDGKRLAYAARTGKAWSVVVDIGGGRQ